MAIIVDIIEWHLMANVDDKVHSANGIVNLMTKLLAFKK